MCFGSSHSFVAIVHFSYLLPAQSCAHSKQQIFHIFLFLHSEFFAQAAYSIHLILLYMYIYFILYIQVCLYMRTIISILNSYVSHFFLLIATSTDFHVRLIVLAAFSSMASVHSAQQQRCLLFVSTSSWSQSHCQHQHHCSVSLPHTHTHSFHLTLSLHIFYIPPFLCHARFTISTL